ncbi:MAG: hypothetical protein H6641_02065 [Caldilineaceae bacterium]|nr:hypothetical protein [Caldilineaceae bacterium]
MQNRADVYEFVSIGELAETTTQLLSLNLHYRTKVGAQPQSQPQSGIEQVEQFVLQRARDYLASVREGFVLSVRTSKLSDQRELRYLLDRVLTDWSLLSEELGLEQSSDAAAVEPEVEQVRSQLLAFGMAAVALGYLPKLPSKRVTFPHSYGNPPTYADISVPDTPGEMLWRIEELEEMIWQFMAEDLNALVQRRYGPLRRTYGFFEASAWLANEQAKRFGIQERKSSLTLL